MGFRNPFMFLLGLVAPGKAGQLIVAGYSISRRPTIAAQVIPRPTVSASVTTRSGLTASIVARPSISVGTIVTSVLSARVVSTSVRRDTVPGGILVLKTATSAVPRSEHPTPNIDVQ